MSTTYRFTEPRLLRFYGGAWDGREAPALAAPLAIIIGPDGSGAAPLPGIVEAVTPPGWSRYERSHYIVPMGGEPIDYEHSP